MPLVLNFIDVPQAVVDRTSDSRDTEMSGLCCNHDAAVVVSGPIVSVCCVAHWEVVCGQCGTRKMIFGTRSIRSSKRDGFMLTHVRRHGIRRDYIVKVSQLDSIRHRC